MTDPALVDVPKLVQQHPVDPETSIDEPAREEVVKLLRQSPRLDRLLADLGEPANRGARGTPRSTRPTRP